MNAKKNNKVHNRVSLYRKQVCVEKNIPQEVAVEHLLALIDSDKQ